MPLSRGAFAGALVALVLLGCITGLGRYLAEREHQAHQLQGLATLADGFALKGLSVSDGMVARALKTGALAVDVVQAGAVDAFGIERGARRVVSQQVPGGREGDLSALQARMAAFGTSPVEAAPDKLRFEAAASQETSSLMLSAYAPIRSDDGATVGLVRVAALQTSGEDVIPWWRLLLALSLAAASVQLFRRLPTQRRRAAFGCGLGVLAFGLGLGRDGDFAVMAGLLVMPLGWAAFQPVCDLLRGLREQPSTYLYVLPAVLATVVLVFVPFSMGVVLAFFDSHGAPVGIENFREILVTSETADTNFWWTFGVTVVWTVTNITLHVAIGLALALVLNRPKLELRWLYRVLLIVPWAVPNYITALIWKGMFNEHEGAVNAVLAIFGVGAIDWFGTSVLANFTANLVTNVWLGFPFMMVVCLGALQAIPRELYEAARIDGAGRLQSFRHVTLPLLKPALVPAVIVGTIWTFNMFNVIYLVSGGGPDGQTDILITEAYHSFKVLKRYGLAAAYSLLIFVILYAYGAMTNRVTRATEGAFE
ncbi:MAG: carbohydrate ABC transporter permease [Myxococcota bacterium]